MGCLISFTPPLRTFFGQRPTISNVISSDRRPRPRTRWTFPGLFIHNQWSGYYSASNIASSDRRPRPRTRWTFPGLTIDQRLNNPFVCSPDLKMFIHLATNRGML